MGWSKGKGLGANENGNPDFIHVKYKSDNAGFGFADRNDGWTKHEEDFEGFLKSLSNSTQNSDTEEQYGSLPTSGFGFQKNQLEHPTHGDITHKLSGESLEEKSKNSRARVHYKKFTRSKDLSQYSEKDLANIFGKKSLNMCAKKDFKQENEDIKEENAKDSEIIHSFGVTTISSGTSINDYFKKKNLERDTSNILLNGNSLNKITAQSEDNISKRSKKSKKARENKDISVSVDELSEVPKKKKKKKREYQGLIENGRSDFQEEMQSGELFDKKDNSGEQFDKKKSKKRKNSEVNIKEKESSTQQLLEDDLPQIKKAKRRKNKNNLEVGEIVGHLELIQQNADQNVEEVQNLEIKVDKNSTEKSVYKSDEKNMEQKGNHEKHDIRDMNVANPMEVLQDNSLEYDVKKLKRKKHKKTKDVDTDSIPSESPKMVNGGDNPTQHEQEENNGRQDENSVRKSKSKKRHKENTNDVENCVQEIPSHTKVTKDTIECSTKKTNHEIKKEKENFDTEISSREYEEIHHSKSDLKSNTQESPKQSENQEEKAQSPSTNSKEKDLQNTTVSDNSAFKLSAYCAEVFRHADIKGFEDSNLDKIIGYGLSENISIVIEYRKCHEQKIAEMWCDVIQKRKQLERNGGPKNKRNISLKRLTKKKAFLL